MRIEDKDVETRARSNVWGRSRWKHIERLFQEALERPDRDRLAFLKQQCAGDEALLSQVVELPDNVDEGANPDVDYCAGVRLEHQAGSDRTLHRDALMQVFFAVTEGQEPKREWDVKLGSASDKSRELKKRKTLMNRKIRTQLITCVLLIVGTTSPAAFGQNTLRPVGVDNRQLPVLEDADLQQASMTFHPGSARLALQLEQAGVDRRLWRSPISQNIRTLEAGQGGSASNLSGGLGAGVSTPGTPLEEARPTPPPARTAADDIVLIEHSWLTGRMRTQRLLVDGRIFYIIQTDPKHIDRLLRPDEGSDLSHYVVVAVEEGESTPPALFRTEGEPPVIHENASPRLVVPFPGPGEFAAAPWESGIAIIYRDRGGIFARHLNIQGNALAFEGEPWLIASAPETIARYQLLARTGDDGILHLAWAMVAADDRTTLHYCRLIPQDRNGCDGSVEMSRDIAVSEHLSPINLMLQGGNVYLSWIDTRYTRGGWTRRNTAKLFVAGSQDGGRSFAAPVVLNQPRDRSDNARYAVTLPAQEGGVLVFWTTEAVQGSGWQRLPFHAGWLNGELNQLQVGNTTVSGEQVEAVLEQWALAYHQNLGL